MQTGIQKLCAAVLTVLMIITALSGPIAAAAAQPEEEDVAAGFVTVTVRKEDIEKKGAAGEGGAIQAALDLAKDNATDAQPYKIVVEPGEYTVGEDSLLVYSNTWLSLDGVTIRRSAADSTMLRFGKEDGYSTGVTGYAYRNITIENGTFNGNRALGTMLKFGHAKNVLMRNVMVTNNGNSHMMEIAAVDGLSIIGCHFIDQIAYATDAYEAVQIDVLKEGNLDGYRSEDLSVNHILVENCEFRNCPRGVGSHTAVLNNPHNDVVIRNNTFTNMGSVAIQSLNWTNCVIANNVVDTAPRGIVLYTTRSDIGGTFPSSVFAAEGNTTAHFVDRIPTYQMNAVIENNELINCGAIDDKFADYEKTGIGVMGAKVSGKLIPDGTYYYTHAVVRHNKVHMRGNGIRVEYAKDIVVEGNEVLEDNTRANPNDYGIVVRNYTSNISIRDNYISNARTNGIMIDGHCDIDRISGNEIYHCGKYGIGAYSSVISNVNNNDIRRTVNYGIFAHDGAYYDSITDNRLMYIQNKAIHFTSTSAGGRVINNNTLYQCSGGAPFGSSYSNGSTMQSIKPSEKKVTLKPGNYYRIAKTISPVNALYNYSYYSSNPQIADVDNAGLVTAIADGTADITVYTDDASAKVTVTVRSDPPAVVCGDVDGDGLVTDADYAYLTAYLAKWEGYDSVSSAADVNRDGLIDGRDRIALARYLEHMSGYESLPVDANGGTAAEKGEISVSSAQAKRGEAVTVTVKLDRNPGVCNLTMALDYDETVLTPESVTDGGLLQTTEVQHSNQLQAPYQFTWLNDLTNGNNTSTGILATLTFRVNESAPSGDYTVALRPDTVEAYNGQLQRVPFTLTDGVIAVRPSGAVSGTIASTVTDKPVTVSLIPQGAQEAAAVVSADAGKAYLLEQVERGVYLLRVEQSGCVPLESVIEVGDEPVGQSFVLHQFGDVNNDGRVTIEDATLLQQYLAEFRNADGTPVLDEQDALLMKMLDVNGSGTADIGDVTAIQQKIAELSK